MKYLLRILSNIIITLCFLSNMYGQLESDDYLHFAGGAASGAVGAFVASELSNEDPIWTFTGSLAGSLLAGVAKETIDSSGRGGWDNRDLGATLLGGLTVGISIEIFSSKKRRRNKQTANSSFEFKLEEHLLTYKPGLHIKLNNEKQLH